MSAPPRPVLRANQVVRWLSERVAEHAGVPVSSIDPRASFASYGLDSAAAVSLAGDLETWMGTTIDATALFEYPTIERLAEALTQSP